MTASCHKEQKKRLNKGCCPRKAEPAPEPNTSNIRAPDDAGGKVRRERRDAGGESPLTFEWFYEVAVR